MNVFIVESHNDEYFLRALIEEVNGGRPERVITVDDFQHSSLSKENLAKALSDALSTINLARIGIVLDLDQSARADRIELINSSLALALQQFQLGQPFPEVSNTNEFITFTTANGFDVQLACFFTNVDGEGELETLLWHIRTQAESPFADCLDAWKDCLIGKGKVFLPPGQPSDLSTKELLKLKVDFYKRFDTLKRSDRTQRTTDWKGIWLGKTEKGETAPRRGPDIFNLDSGLLNELRSFLELFA